MAVTWNMKFQWQRGDAARWVELNPVLRVGEPGLETDTGNFKVGDGYSSWTQLPYFLNEFGVVALVTEMLADLGAGSFDPRVGRMVDLSTSNQTTIVEAINEVNTPDIPFILLYENAKAGES